MVDQGSIIRVDFEAYDEDGELFDTTRRDVAEEHDAVHEDEFYEPMPVVVGANRVVEGFDEALAEAEVGESRKIEVPPEKGFGERDPDEIETFSKREFERRDEHAHPGMRVRIEGREGVITQVTSGRVRVDFNPPLAGDTLTYDFEIVEEVTDPADQLHALLDLDYEQGRGEDFEVMIEETEGDDETRTTAAVTLPEKCKYDERWFLQKYRLVADIRQYVDVDEVRFVEVHDLGGAEGEMGAPIPEELEQRAEESATPPGVEPVGDE
jgi:FKBP-type peptidyl-prolyl cis-trans isomerase 2